MKQKNGNTALKQAGGMSSRVASPAQMAYDSAVPDSNTLLAYKLLKDSWGSGQGALFQDLLRNEMKYLMGGITLLNNDPWISSKMGGATMKNASVLANVLKNKAMQMDFDDRINPVAADILYHSYGRPGKKGLQPNKIQNTNMVIDGDGNAQLQFKTSAPDSTQIGLVNPDAAGNYAQSAGYTSAINYGRTIFG